jgi:transcriptional regulator with XRE-family HTH domain
MRLELKASKPRSCGYPKELKTLGDHIRKRRLDLGLLQREVAERVGVDETTILNWEKGRTEPAKRMRSRILIFLKSEQQGF